MQRIITVIFFTILSMNSVATESQLAPTEKSQEYSATQSWLELQRSGASASSQQQSISGEVMDRTHQRYLKSFEKPIPEFYKHDAPVTR